MRKTPLLAALPFLLLLLTFLSCLGSCRTVESPFLQSEYHVRAVSGGCLIDPRPRPAPPPPGDPQFVRVDGLGTVAVEYERYEANETPPYKVRFRFVLAQNDRLRFAKYRAKDGDPYFELANGQHEVVLTVDQGEVYFELDGQARVMNRKDGDVDIGGPVFPPAAVRLSKIDIAGVRQGAVGIELEAFGVQTGFTLIDSLVPPNVPADPPTGTQLLLAPRWAVGGTPRTATDRIVQVRPVAVPSEHWHSLEYWPSSLKDGRYELGFRLDVPRDEFFHLATYRSS